MIPRSQVEWLSSQGFLVVIPNYRLAPQVTGKTSFADCEEAYDWVVGSLSRIKASTHIVELDTSRVVAMGHSSGGTIALHIASVRPVKAVTAFYPSLYISDTTSSAHQPTSAPPFGMFPDFKPSEEDWATIKPHGRQLSEVALAAPGTPPLPRNKWQFSILKNGDWISTLCPDGDYASLDPLTRINSEWPATMLVQGEIDNVPGSGLELAQRAQKELKAAGVKEAKLSIVPGEGHMFDMPPTVGTSDLGPKWQAVVEGLEFLKAHV